ncbi:MAG TPA: hypothetical protein VHY37_02555 [Tepidisphaeraceae bacterium]|nr:hypothetical protein [Tepidisphaeraceae bacterium]
MDRTLIDKYESGGPLLKSAIAGVSPVELRWHPPADAGIGLWSIQQIVLHLIIGEKRRWREARDQ